MEKHPWLDKLTRHSARLEVLVAELLDQKRLDAGALVVRPSSLFRRSYSQDVVGVETVEPSAQNRRAGTQVILEVSREGLYDALPEFLFYAPESSTGYKNLEQRLKDSEQIREEEKAARQFFLPFEQEFFRQRIALEREERTLLTGFSNPMQGMIFERFWTDLKGIPPFQAAVLFHLLPLAYKIAGNQALMATCFETVLQDRVTLLTSRPGPVSFDQERAPALGEVALGVDWIIGSTLAEELPDLCVQIGPIDLDDLPAYLEGEKTQLLDILYSYFVPAEIDVRTQLVLKKEEEGFLLTNDQATARLGYSTSI